MINIILGLYFYFASYEVKVMNPSKTLNDGCMHAIIFPM